MENFTNSVLLPESLPEIEKKAFNALEKKYLSLLFIRLILFFLVLIGGSSVFIVLKSEGIPQLAIIIGLVVWFVSFVLSGMHTYFGFPRKGYLLRENDISFQKGLIVYKLTTVPFNRIQHVEVVQGFIPKLFKLATIKLFTAGGNASDLSIPGLSEADAQKLKEFLSEKISEHE